jgi:HD-like signal output (HDOD) protein
MLHTALSPDAINRLPTPKGVALALAQACRREDVRLDEIASLVRTDPALSGRLLALANTAALGGRALASADEAVVRMGLTRVSQLALAFSLIDQHGAGACANFNYAGFWNRSLLMAAAASVLGSLSKIGPADELFTVGLLAQIGQLALATSYPKEYSNLMALNIDQADLLRREKAITRTDHLELSVALMEHWGIPIDYARPFGLHEVAQASQFSANAKLESRARLAHTAWQVALALSDKGADAVLEDPECSAALQWLQLAPDALTGHLQAIESQWRVWLQLIARHS